MDNFSRSVLLAVFGLLIIFVIWSYASLAETIQSLGMHWLLFYGGIILLTFLYALLLALCIRGIRKVFLEEEFLRTIKKYLKEIFFDAVVMSLFMSTQLSAQSEYPQPANDPVLQQKLSELIKDFHGQVGIYVHQFSTGRTASINADTLFPTASMIKVSIMLKLFDKIDKGELKYDSVLVYRDSLNSYGDGGICGSLKDSTRIPLAEVVMLMMTMSDNIAALWCQSLADSGQAINQWLESHGFHNTRVNSRTPGRHGDWEKYGWGQTTPREMCELLTMIHDGKAVSPAASEEMFRVLSRNYWDKMALGEIPPDVHVASKNGAVDASKSETVFVSAPHGDYVFCAITNHQQDQRWASDNEGYVLMRNIARLLWHYFEPTSTWKPADGMENYWK